MRADGRDVFFEAFSFVVLTAFRFVSVFSFFRRCEGDANFTPEVGRGADEAGTTASCGGGRGGCGERGRRGVLLLMYGLRGRGRDVRGGEGTRGAGDKDTGGSKRIFCSLWFWFPIRLITPPCGRGGGAWLAFNSFFTTKRRC